MMIRFICHSAPKQITAARLSSRNDTLTQEASATLREKIEVLMKRITLVSPRGVYLYPNKITLWLQDWSSG